MTATVESAPVGPAPGRDGRPLRVLLVSHVAPPHIGGVENLVLAEATALADAGHEVVWVTSDAGGDGLVPPPHPRLRIERVRAWHGLERRFGIAWPLFAPRLVPLLWREATRADVVHAHGLVFLGSPLAMVFARCAGRHAVCTDHGGLLRYPSRLATFGLRVLFATMGRITAFAAHRLVAYNGDVDKLMRRLAGAGAKVRFATNPVDESVFRPPTADERAALRAELGWDERPRVLCVARLLPHKGIDVLLDAQDPAFELVFCGPGGDDVRRRIRARGAVCLEPRPQAEVAALYRAADAFALPSSNEGFPVAIQEALACGLPVVTSDAEAYAPYRATPGLHLCPPTPDAVRARLRDVLGARAAASSARRGGGAPGGERAAPWLRLLAPEQALPAGRRRGIAALVVALLALHFMFAVVRWPFGAVGKRAASIAEFEQHGATAWHLRHDDDETRRIAAWLVATVPPGHCVLVRGYRPGGLQLLAPLLYPRLLVDIEQLEPGREPPLPVFRGGPGDPDGVPAVVAWREGLRLEWR